MTLNFEGGADDIPTFSFADLRACAIKGDKRLFSARPSRERLSFSAPFWPIADRRLTSKRFATGIEGAAGAALRGREHAGDRKFQAHLDRRCLYPCHRRQQSDRAERGDRTRPTAGFPDRRARRRPRRRGRVALQTGERGPHLCDSFGAWRRSRDARFHPCTGAADRRTIPCRPCRARRHGRLSFHRRRQGPAAIAEQFCALPRPARHRPHAVVEQVARARRRNAPRHRVLLRHRGIFADRRKNVAGQPDVADERISLRNDRHHRGAWRICRQIYRRFHRRGVRRAGRRSRSRRQCRARRARLLRAACRAQQHIGRFPRLPSFRSASASIPARRWSAISDRGGASIIP